MEKYNEIQLTKNKMAMSIQKLKNHTGLSRARTYLPRGYYPPKVVDELSN